MSDDPLNSGSDLTDIDEEDDVPLSAREKARAKASDDSGYMIRGALRVPRATTYTCQALYDQIYAGDIDLQPEYQRDVVWPDNKQIGLIDSIFRNFYVPPVIFVVHIAPDGAERRVCVDGKQRLTSIYRVWFLLSKVYWRGTISSDSLVRPVADKDPFTGERFWFKINSNIKGQILPERYRKMFLNKQIVCMEYQDISPENEREIFQRVQLGMALTPAERLQAISSPVTSFIRELLDTYIVGQLADAIEWDTSRANDFRTLAMAVYGMSKWPKLTTAPSLATIEKWLHESDELEAKFEADVSNTFQVFCQLAVHPQLSSCFKIQGIKKVAPVEMLAISLLIHANKRRMTLAQLSEAITSMRHDVRLVEKDVRLNSRTMKLLLSFVKKLKPSQLTTTSDEKVAASAVRLTGKRKRAVTDSSESDEEEHPSRPAAKSQATAVTQQSTPAQPPPPSLGPPPSPSFSTGPSRSRIVCYHTPVIWIIYRTTCFISSSFKTTEWTTRDPYRTVQYSIGYPTAHCTGRSPKHDRAFSAPYPFKRAPAFTPCELSAELTRRFTDGANDVWAIADVHLDNPSRTAQSVDAVPSGTERLPAESRV
ncbi:hypothetical protein BN946_scf184714.g8 [Trametes cinnabarina]|uniref:GmrSD restriction endonucleases N-terminal domain-containing protein n=1 Tax=Pycnoporus cinnabarinus TaxID=5643 RepID=A0A060SZ82_PYCCI|nr:hypothetical protein BN946_scf184714.g8 [Trametes cinnabarina]